MDVACVPARSAGQAEGLYIYNSIYYIRLNKKYLHSELKIQVSDLEYIAMKKI